MVTPAAKRTRLPNAFLIGAAKSGTSSLYQYLGQHPDIFISKLKEPRFFGSSADSANWLPLSPEEARKRFVSDPAEYASLFAAARDERIVMEGSTGYLHSPVAAEKIREHDPNAKLIAILRNPIDRAYSAFMHSRIVGWESNKDFLDGLDAESDRIRAGWRPMLLYTNRSHYADALEHYLSLFPREQLRVYFYDDLSRRPRALVQDVFRFFGVDPTFEPQTDAVYNPGGKARNPRLFRLLNYPPAPLRRSLRRLFPARTRRQIFLALNRRNIQRTEPMLEAARGRLREIFAPEVARLGELLGRDLSPWLSDDTLPIADTTVGVHPRGQALDYR